MGLPSEIQMELENAELARAEGNVGRARVCARRAAGMAVRDYFARQGVRPRSSSAYELLRLVADDPAVPADLREYAAHLTLRVDEEFSLPTGIDLIAEARALCMRLSAQPKAAG